MLKPTDKIEQWIYTACGKDHTGAFSVWSKSNGLSKQDDMEITQLLNTIKTGNKVISKDIFGKPDKMSFDAEIHYDRQLKQGAVPTGFFKKTYKDSDYEDVETVVRNPIILLKESGSERLEKLGGYNDYRNNLENAPFRVAAVKMQDGRLLVARATYIGEVYSNMDQRSGNLFYHAQIFPAGTELRDIDLSKLHFQKGLDDKYFKGENPQNAPEFLEPVTYGEMINANAKQSSQNQAKVPPVQNTNFAQQASNTQISNIVTNNQAIEILNNSLYGQDVKTRNESKKLLREQIRNGLNVPDVLKTLCDNAIHDIQSGKIAAIDFDDSAYSELGALETPFSNLYTVSMTYAKLKKQKDEFDYDNEDTLMQNINGTKQYLKMYIEKFGLEETIKFAHSQKELIVSNNKLQKIISGKNVTIAELSDNEKLEYNAMDMLERAATQMKNKNLTFEQQTVIR